MGNSISLMTSITEDKVMGNTITQLTIGLDRDKNMKPMVGVDVDEVLCPFVHQLCKFHRSYKHSDLQLSDFTTYIFRDITKYDVRNEQESSELLRKFFESKYFDEMPIIKGSNQTLMQLKSDFNFSIITSRRNSWKIKTLEWINQHYEGIFDDILFGNHFSTEGKPYTKSELLQQVNANILIDDNINYCIQCAKHIDTVILFGNYPWNSNIDSLPSNVYRANDWSDVKHILLSISQS